MNESGMRNTGQAIDTAGLRTSGKVHYNFSAPELCEEAIARGEAKLTIDRALVAYTGQHTGRSPKDKFVVRDANTEAKVWWDNNKPMTPAQFDLLFADFVKHAADKDLFVQDLISSSDRLPIARRSSKSKDCPSTLAPSIASWARAPRRETRSAMVALTLSGTPISSISRNSQSPFRL